MSAAAGDRLLDLLPAVFRQADASGELARLLGVIEQLFFGEPDAAADAPLPGIERTVATLPALFAPLGSSGDPQARTPDRFLHTLAGWLGFTPHRLFGADALRRILAGIVPLHGLRGTRDHLVQLLGLCFDELAGVEVDDRPAGGFAVGAARIGHETRLGAAPPFRFEVVVDLKQAAAPAADGAATLERRLRAVIDFAKPAHTRYGLLVRTPRPPPATAADTLDRSG